LATLEGLLMIQENIDAAHCNSPQPVRGNRGAPILGPRNLPLERENPDLLASADTDTGTIPNLKFSFAAARNRLTPGGFGVSESAFANLPTDLEHTRWIVAGDVPGPIGADTVTSPAGRVPMSYSYRLSAQEPFKVAGSQVRIVDSSNVRLRPRSRRRSLRSSRADCVNCTGIQTPTSGSTTLAAAAA
jgi:hypothetical protein